MNTIDEGLHDNASIDEALSTLTVIESPKANLTKRAFAIVIDLVFAMLLSRIPYIGWFAGVGYMLFRDGFDFEFLNRQSLGKKLMGLKTLRLDGLAVDFAVSVRRNWMFALVTLAGIVFWMPVLRFFAVLTAGFLSLLIGAFEIYLVFNDTEGRRWGDTFAGTKVVEIDE